MTTIRDFWRLYHATRYLKNPNALAKAINGSLAREGFMDEIIANRFATSGSSSGKAWPALKASTVSQRKRLGFASGPTLIRSGFLQNAALKGKTTYDSENIVKHFKDGRAPVYSGNGKAKRSKGTETQKARMISSYAYALHFGSPTRKLPARPFYSQPTPQELQPMYERRNQLIEGYLSRLTQ